MSGSGVKYKALYDFTATQSNTLSFKAGDVFVFVSKSSEDWWSVRTSSGQVGLVPASYLEELKELFPAKDAVPVTYRALYDYTGMNGSQLTFKHGDTMVLVDMPSTGWWSMRHSVSGKQGLVPANYVEKAALTSTSTTTATSTTTNVTNGASKASASVEQPNLKDEKVRAEVILSIDRAIEAIHLETTKAGGQVTSQQRAALTRLFQHRQQTLAMGTEPLITEDRTNTTVTPDPTTVLPPPSTTTPTITSLQPTTTTTTTTSNRQSLYMPSQGSGDSSDALDQRQRSATLPRRQAPPPPKRDERYTLSTPRSPSSSPRTSTYAERGATPDPVTAGVKAQSGPNLTTPGSPSRGHVSPVPSPLHASLSEATHVGRPTLPADTSSSSMPDKLPGEGVRGGGKSADEVVAMLSSFCDDLVISMEMEVEKTSPPGSPYRARTLSNPRRSPSRSQSNVVVEPLLPLVPGVNEAAAVVMTTAATTTASTTTQHPNVAVTVTPAATPTVVPSATPTSVVSAMPTVAPSATPTAMLTAAVVSTPPPPSPPTLRTEFADQDASELVEAVRVGTGMNYKNTLLAVSAVLDFLKAKVPETSGMVEGLLKALHSSQTGVSTISNDQLISKDVERLREAFFQIKDCKDDTQQRGWAVHDDHHIISGYLSELLQLLCDADPDISRRVIKEDKYENILTLIEFYHLEPRVPLRLLMLKIFAALCELDPTVIGILLSSVLPNELGRDIQQGISETEKALYSSTVCTIIFSTGEAVPLSVYDQWNKDYVLFLLDTIEQPPSTDRQEVLPDAFMTVILSFNQHFQDPSSNLVMCALKERPNPKAFSEKLMLLVNRGEDPVAGHCEPNSLLKIVLDIFTDRVTSGIFYTTDLMVLIDIIHRQLSDLEAGSKTRTHYLELLYRVLSTTEYSEHNRRQRELTSCLARIAREDMEESERDRAVVERIRTTFPAHFEESTAV